MVTMRPGWPGIVPVCTCFPSVIVSRVSFPPRSVQIWMISYLTQLSPSHWLSVFSSTSESLRGLAKPRMASPADSH